MSSLDRATFSPVGMPVAVPLGAGATGTRPRTVSAGRLGLYVFLIICVAFFLLPLYVMVITSFKPMSEIRLGNFFALPEAWTIEPWIKAWSEACISIACDGIGPGFWTSVQILIPSIILSLLVGSLTGYALSFWRPRGGAFVMGVLMLGAFLPAQVFIYPLIQMYSRVGLASSITALVFTHVIFGLPVLTLLFRNFFASLPIDLFKAARVDGAGFFQTFVFVMLPMSLPMMVVGAILKITWVWNDYIVGLVFGGVNNRPMMVLLMNLVSGTDAEVEYNVNMAATILTAAVPLVVYLVSGRWFVRGISAGAVKG